MNTIQCIALLKTIRTTTDKVLSGRPKANSAVINKYMIGQCQCGKDLIYHKSPKMENKKEYGKV